MSKFYILPMADVAKEALKKRNRSKLDLYRAHNAFIYKSVFQSLMDSEINYAYVKCNSQIISYTRSAKAPETIQKTVFIIQGDELIPWMDAQYKDFEELKKDGCTEKTYHGRQIIIDAAYIDTNLIEIMCFDSKSGHEYDVKRTTSLDEAEKLYQAMRNEYSDQPYAALTGKYAKLRDDLKKAIQSANEADSPKDGGTCNFDSPAIIAPRWIEKKVKQAAKEAGTTASKWTLWGSCNYVFGVPGSGQGNRRSRKSAAMMKSLRGSGYDVIEYQQMD